jgi:hypothetical protein
MVGYATQVSWVLIAAFALSLPYELYRSTAKAGTSKYDSMRTFLTEAVPSYAVAFALAVLVRTGWQWVAWTVLAVAVALIMISILCYSPIILSQRKPGPSTGWRTRSTRGCCLSLSPFSPTTYSGRRWSRSELSKLPGDRDRTCSLRSRGRLTMPGSARPRTVG